MVEDSYREGTWSNTAQVWGSKQTSGAWAAAPDGMTADREEQDACEMAGEVDILRKIMGLLGNIQRTSQAQQTSVAAVHLSHERRSPR